MGFDELIGVTAQIGAEDVSWGSGLPGDVFDTVAPGGSAISKTKVPSLSAVETSRVKGVYYLGVGGGIVDHSATSGADWESYNLARLISEIGSDVASIHAPSGEIDLGGHTVPVPANVTFSWDDGFVVANGTLVVNGSHTTKNMPDYSTMISAPGVFSGQSVRIAYLAEDGDFGGGPFRWAGDSSETVSYGLIGAVDGVSIGRWVRDVEHITDKMAGAKYDGTTDDTDAIRRSLAYASGRCKVVHGPGTAMINAETQIDMPSDTHAIFLPGTEWKAITNSLDSYIIMDIRDVQHVVVWSPVLTGDALTHTGTTGEQGHCLNISQSDAGDTSNIHIYNPVLTRAWGDGLVVRKGSNIHFYNTYCKYNRRNGITLNKGSDVHWYGRTYSGYTSGVAPEAGFDIEPNDATGELANITVENLVTEANAGPACTYNIGDFPGAGIDKDVSISIGRHDDTGSLYGLNIEKCGLGTTEKIQGLFSISEAVYKNNGSCGLYINDYAAENTPHIVVEKLHIIDPNELNLSSVQFGAAIAFDRKAGSGLTNNIGNISILNPIIEDNRTTNQMTRGIAAVDNDGSGALLKNVFILDPLKIKGYDAVGDAFHIAMKGARVVDTFGVSERALTGSVSITSRSQRKIKTSSASPFTVTDGLTGDNAGMPLILESTGTGGLTFDPAAARAIYPLSSVPGKYVNSTTKGAFLEIEMRADGHWYVLRQVGTWTVEA